MYAWVFRHRHGLRTIYGLPPEERLAGLIERSQGRGRRTLALGSRRGADAERRRRATAEAGASDARASSRTARVRQMTIRPHPPRG